MSKLFLVPTPLGNLGDMTLRAVEVLKQVDLILAEDTRKSGHLLKHFGISNQLLPHHKFNEHKTIRSVIDRLSAGADVALITDAGTPGISDPGFLLIRACLEHGLEVETLPGPSAFLPALINSGIPCDRFTFEGFLPHKKGRMKRLGELSAEHRTMVFYESPHRLEKTLAQLAEQMGPERKASVSREISKLHEETLRGTLKELTGHFSAHPPRGEIVIVVEGSGSAGKKVQ